MGGSQYGGYAGGGSLPSGWAGNDYEYGGNSATAIGGACGVGGTGFNSFGGGGGGGFGGSNADTS